MGHSDSRGSPKVRNKVQPQSRPQPQPQPVPAVVSVSVVVVVSKVDATQARMRMQVQRGGSLQKQNRRISPSLDEASQVPLPPRRAPLYSASASLEGEEGEEGDRAGH
jgi:hypothetical protein